MLNAKITYKVYLSILCFIALGSCKKNDVVSTVVKNPVIDTVIGGNLIFQQNEQYVFQDGFKLAYQSTSPCAPSAEVFYFSASSISGIEDGITYKWTFWDGPNNYTKYGKKQQFMYALQGRYPLTLQVLQNNAVITQIDTAVQAFGQAVQARNVVFVNNYIDNNIPQYQAFTSLAYNSSNGWIVGYAWDFGDGTGYDTGRFVNHYFPKLNQNKLYDVKLMVYTNSGCTDTAKQKVYVRAYNKKPCSFGYFSTNACKPDTETFTFMADTVGFPSTAQYEWDFADYTSNQPRVPIIQHKFAYPNKYIVKLKVWDKGRQLCYYEDTNFKAKGMLVTPLAAFDRSPTSFNFQTIDSTSWFFQDKSQFWNGENPIAYYWDFGDGYSAQPSQYIRNATHTYQQKTYDQIFTVKLFVMSTSGCKDSTSRTVIVPAKR